MARQAGFSLLELLVALAVLALLASISWRGLDSTLGAQARVQAEMRRWQDLDRVMQQLARDVSLAVERPAREAAGELVITRLGEAEAGPAQSGLRRVGYRVRDGKLEYLSWPSARPPAGAVPAASVVLEDVARLEVRETVPAALTAEIVLAGGERVWRVFPLP